MPTTAPNTTELSTDAPRLLTVRETAIATRAHQNTVLRWIRIGKLPAVRIGRKHLIDREDLERMLTPAASR